MYPSLAPSPVVAISSPVPTIDPARISPGPICRRAVRKVFGGSRIASGGSASVTDEGGVGSFMRGAIRERKHRRHGSCGPPSYGPSPPDSKGARREAGGLDQAGAPHPPFGHPLPGG